MDDSITVIILIIEYITVHAQVGYHPYYGHGGDDVLSSHLCLANRG